MLLDEVALEGRLMSRLASARVAQAVRVSTAVHEGVFRDEGAPYIRHPLRVALILVEELGVHDEDLACAALLHDALEEDGASIDEAAIRDQFGARVGGLVHCLTDEFRSSGLARAERKRRYLERIGRGSEDCILVKLCDRLDNLRSLPYSPDAVKRRNMAVDTRTHLMPLAASLGGPFPVLQDLLRAALDRCADGPA
jgi:GTP pyrophosphokinase